MSCRLVSFGRAGLAVFVIATLSCGGGGTEPVVPVLTTVTVTLSSPTIQVAQTASATVTGLDQNGASIAVGAVTWSTGSASVASITAAGVVTGVAPGQTVVIASAGGKQGQQSLTVLAVPVASVTVSPAAPSVVVGGTQQLTATTLDATGATLTGRTITWTTSDATKATVNSTGLVTAVAGGTATITATSEGKSGTSAVTVTVPVATVTVAPATASIAVGATQQFTATLKDASGNTLTGRTVTWTSMNTNYATVNSSTGLATAVAAGTATIKATSETKEGTATLTVSGLTCTGTPQLGCGLASDQFSQIPTGTFQMGSTAGNSDETPVHTVTISSFNMQKTEVTQGQWREVMGTNPSSYSTCGDTCPVETVSWDDIQTFLTTLNARTPGVTYRLPTEAEWEYAARAGTTGETYGALDSIAWYHLNSGGTTHAAAGKQANAWGLYDMIGNVWEWVNDWYGPYTSASATNPSGPATGSIRVLRGGSWDGDGSSASAAWRANGYPANRNGINGFRLVRTP